ncbi:MAG: site-2 protease family protein, partial [Planctomycetota bacterium]
MNLLSSGFDIILIVLGFGMLIFVHELGHFLAAKWAGIRTEAFAVGMGPVMVSWRQGTGLALGSTHRKVVAQTGHAASDLSTESLAEHGIGETEYSLRWLPIGGFVKMLGQEDANPTAVSDDPRSYTQCSIGKRMIVVSAGVIMNLILAAVLFVIAFLAGVPMLAPVVGSVSPSMPAGQVVASNAAALGVSKIGLQPGDTVLTIDGKQAKTFADLQIASAMGRPGVPIDLTIEREGIDEPLQFTVVPTKDKTSGLLGLGIVPGASTRLLDDDRTGVVQSLLEDAGLWDAGVRPGMTLQTVGGRVIKTYEQVADVIAQSDGAPVTTTWGDGTTTGIVASLDVSPRLQRLVLPEKAEDGFREFEQGLIGLVPLTRISAVDGANADVLKAGDIVLSIQSTVGPRMTEIQAVVRQNARATIDMTVLRDGARVVVQPTVSRKGMLGVGLVYAVDEPYVARPLDTVRDIAASASTASANLTTPIAGLAIPGGARITRIGDLEVTSWTDIRRGLLEASSAGSSAEVEMAFEHPTAELESETVVLALNAEETTDLHALGWSVRLPGDVFEPIRETLSAGGSPIRAITMGIEETHKLIVMTYLTIDRLFRGSVGVEQLRGPLGIVHIGTKVLDGGFLYLVFFLAMISVNLAVINFLPIPIVDGGLFLFLVYEKLKGRPPSIAFQNAATVVG